MNDLPGQANGYGQPGNDHASSRTEPGNAERLTGIYGSEGWRFESLRARQVSSPFRSWKGLLANAGANSGYPAAFMIRAKMPGGDDMHLGTGQQQGRRVDMTQIMQPGVR